MERMVIAILQDQLGAIRRMGFIYTSLWMVLGWCRREPEVFDVVASLNFDALRQRLKTQNKSRHPTAISVLDAF